MVEMVPVRIERVTSEAYPPRELTAYIIDGKREKPCDGYRPYDRSLTLRQPDREPRKRETETQAARVSQKYARPAAEFMTQVIDEESSERPCHYHIQYLALGVARHGAADAEPGDYYESQPACETVKTVDQVHGVHHQYYGDYGERNGHPSRP